MSVKLLLTDFDGTLVDKDILDVLCGINGKEQESKELNEAFIAGKRDGLPTLKKRIDYLEGVSNDDIRNLLDKRNYLIEGAQELFSYTKLNGITTVLHSGNIIPTLAYYKNLLGIDYIVGTSPRMDGDVIKGIELSDFNSRDFKVLGCKEIINKLGIDFSEIVAIGDSPSDKGVFELAKITIAINPKGDISDYATHVVYSDLREVVKILENYKN